MLIAGAGGHAVEIIDLLESRKETETIQVFDDSVITVNSQLFSKFKIISSLDDAKVLFLNNKSFCLGVGNPTNRKTMDYKLTSIGGELVSVFSQFCQIGQNEVQLGIGLNVMAGAIISSRTKIGRGVLFHMYVSVHHDVIIGDYCELSPGCRILGNARLGDNVSVGTNAVVMPGVFVGSDSKIGAGAVVTQNVQEGATLVGIPARPVRK